MVVKSTKNCFPFTYIFAKAISFLLSYFNGLNLVFDNDSPHLLQPHSSAHVVMMVKFVSM